jgi:hypothetical protein
MAQCLREQTMNDVSGEDNFGKPAGIYTTRIDDGHLRYRSPDDDRDDRVQQDS